MAYISCDSKIIIKYQYGDQNPDVINDTNYLPLRICCNIVLLSDNKLYMMIVENRAQANFVLVELAIETECDYTVDSADFTENFAKINSEYYEINHEHKFLHKLLIIVKTSQNIIKMYNTQSKTCDYCYISTNNKLMLFNDHDQNHILLDDNSDAFFL
jgi:hypothetical protein